MRAWDDRVVGRFRRVDALTSAVRSRIDDILTDWTFIDWDSGTRQRMHVALRVHCLD